MSSKFTDFNIDQGAYVAFDATSLRELIVNRLKSQGVFTDQVFEGSNLSSIIDVISYSYHTLMFYLNKTSTETMFTDAQIYENMNRIVKLLNYKPVGYQTSVLSYNASVSADLPIGTYTIPRYTTVDVGGIPFVFPHDITFTKPVLESLDLAGINEKFLLYQGEYTEYPIQTAVGESFEPIILAVDTTSVLVDHFNIGVYVKDAETGEISEYEETTSLYHELPGSKKYEKRLNENLRYELRFGNNINGKQLNTGDAVMIYYIKSEGSDGQVGVNSLKDSPLTLYTTPQFNTIKEAIKSEDITYMNFDNIKTLILDNQLPSTEPRSYEEVETIREQAPKHFLGQERLITSDDFTLFVKRNFGNIINDAKAVNNETYINGHLNYLYSDIGLEKPTLESRILFNQANFSTSTNFNNVYLYCVPRSSRKSSLNIQTNFLPVSQKETIRNSMEANKSLSIDPVFADPVYMAVDICVGTDSESMNADTTGNTVLEVTKSSNVIRNSDSIRQNVHSIIIDYFNVNNCTLGQVINIDKLVAEILSIDGVAGLRTVRTDVNTAINGLGLLIWNPVYDGKDNHLYNQNVQLPYYKFPYFFNELTFLSRINVVEST